MMGPLWLLGGVGVYGMLPILFLYLCSLPTAQPAGQQTRRINIGAILSTNTYGSKFKESIAKINQEHGSTRALPQEIEISGSYILLDDNPIKTSENICNRLITKKVSVVIVSERPSAELSPVSVSFTCGFYRIPVIGIATRNSVFSDKVGDWD